MVDSSIDQVLNEENLISNPLKMFFIRIWCNSDGELLLAVFRECFKSVILGCLDELTQLQIPVSTYDLFDFSSVNGDSCFEERHSTINILLLY